MRRDDDLIRRLMLDLEQANRSVGQAHQVPGYTQEQVAYHLALILQAGLAEGMGPIYGSTGGDPTIPASVQVKRLTPTGHDFIANLRDDTVWTRVKERAAKAGGTMSLEVLTQLGGSVIKQMLGISV